MSLSTSVDREIRLSAKTDRVGTRARAARWLIGLATAAYGYGSLLLDLNATHLFQPEWPAHARLHVVWFIGTCALLGTAGLWLTFSRADNWRWRARLAAALGLFYVSAFFVAAITGPLYGGDLHDPGTEMKILGLDGNVTACIVMGAMLATGLWLLRQSPRVNPRAAGAAA